MHCDDIKSVFQPANIFFSSCSLSMESHCGIVARLLVVSFIAVCCSGESDAS